MKIAALILAMIAVALSGYAAWFEYNRKPEVIAVPIARVLVPSAVGSDFQLKASAQLQFEALQHTIKELEGRGYDVTIPCADRFCYDSADIRTSYHYRVQVSKTTELK